MNRPRRKWQITRCMPIANTNKGNGHPPGLLRSARLLPRSLALHFSQRTKVGFFDGFFNLKHKKGKRLAYRFPREDAEIPYHFLLGRRGFVYDAKALR